MLTPFIVIGPVLPPYIGKSEEMLMVPSGMLIISSSVADPCTPQSEELLFSALALKASLRLQPSPLLESLSAALAETLKVISLL